MLTTLRHAVLGRCPRCGKGRLFDGLLVPAKCCNVCGLDYTVFESGDGPAPFVILLVGAVVCGAALWVEFTYSPPLWVHLVLWVPTILVLGIAVLRVIKGLLIGIQYLHKAGEGRIAPP